MAESTVSVSSNFLKLCCQYNWSKCTADGSYYNGTRAPRFLVSWNS